MMKIRLQLKLSLSALALHAISLLPAQDFNGNIFMDSERSYIQLANIKLPPRNNNSESSRLTAMEAQISPNYFIKLGQEKKFALVITPKVILRLGDRESFPIKAPSYMPSIGLFQRLNGTRLKQSPLTNWLISPTHTVLLLYRITHHSNGQKDGFFTENGNRINYATGNFSTDYFEFGFQWIKLGEDRTRFHLDGRLTYERHLNALTREEAMNDIYYYNRFILDLSLQINPALSLTIRPEWMTGKNTFQNKGAFTGTLEYMPFRKKSDLGLFLRYYNGPDYYNIRYFQKQTSYGIGIKARPVQQG